MEMTDCEHKWEPLEFEDGEKSKAQVCPKCGALKSGQGSIVITADYIDFSPLTANPALAEGRQWFRSDFDALYWSPDGSTIERIKMFVPFSVSGSLTGIKGFEYLVECGTDATYEFTMNPSAGIWIKQYSTAASFQAKMVYHGAYQHWTGNNTFVDVPSKAENVYGAGEEAVVHQVPDGTQVGGISPVFQTYDVTWDGEYFWAVHRLASYVYKLQTDGTIVDRFAAPGPEASGVTWDGNYLWVADRTADYTYQIDTAGGTISGFINPAADIRGISWDGEYLWQGGSVSGFFYKLLPDGTVKDKWASPGTRASAMAWDGEYLWGADWVALTIYQLKRDGTQVGSFAGPGGERGVTWDGQYLYQGSKSIIYRFGSAGSFDLDYKIVAA